MANCVEGVRKLGVNWMEGTLNCFVFFNLLFAKGLWRGPKGKMAQFPEEVALNSSYKMKGG